MDDLILIKENQVKYCLYLSCNVNKHCKSQKPGCIVKKKSHAAGRMETNFLFWPKKIQQIQQTDDYCFVNYSLHDFL